MRFLICVVFLSIVLLPGCKTDFEINDDWEDITIVYGLLNSGETTHYIRVQKAFLGNASAYDMAQYSDSILYQQGIHVYMEEWKNGSLKKTFDNFEKVYIPKDSGVFACDNHYVFKTTGALDASAEYRIFIEKAGKQAEDESKPISDVRASAEWRKQMVNVLTRRALEEAQQRAKQR